MTTTPARLARCMAILGASACGAFGSAGCGGDAVSAATDAGAGATAGAEAGATDAQATDSGSGGVARASDAGGEPYEGGATEAVTARFSLSRVSQPPDFELRFVASGVDSADAVYLEPFPTSFATSAGLLRITGVPKTGLDTAFCGAAARWVTDIERGAAAAATSMQRLRQGGEYDLSLLYAPPLTAEFLRAVQREAVAIGARGVAELANNLDVESMVLELVATEGSLVRRIGDTEALEAQARADLDAQSTTARARGEFRIVTPARDLLCDLWAGDVSVVVTFTGLLGQTPYRATTRVSGVELL